MFQLIWLPHALDELSDIWVAISAVERDRLGPAVERLNQSLERDPFEVGESRDDPARVISLGLVTVYFTVRGGVVRVFHVHRRR